MQLLYLIGVWTKGLWNAAPLFVMWTPYWRSPPLLQPISGHFIRRVQQQQQQQHRLLYVCCEFGLSDGFDAVVSVVPFSVTTPVIVMCAIMHQNVLFWDKNSKSFLGRGSRDTPSHISPPWRRNPWVAHFQIVCLRPRYRTPQCQKVHSARKYTELLVHNCSSSATTRESLIVWCLSQKQW